MSGAVKSVFKAGGALLRVGTKALFGGGKKKPGESIDAPSIDDAAMNQQVADRIQRRRGVLANIFGGQRNSTPSVGTKTLTGQ